MYKKYQSQMEIELANADIKPSSPSASKSE